SRDGYSREYGYAAGEIKIGPGTATEARWPRLAVKLQDQRTRFTADYTFELDDDLAHTPPEPLRCEGAPIAAPATPRAAATGTEPASWIEAMERSPFWSALTGGDGALARLARELVGEAWRAWADAAKVRPDPPWRDQRYPVRVLARLAALA